MRPQWHNAKAEGMNHSRFPQTYHLKFFGIYILGPFLRAINGNQYVVFETDRY